jgi:hypothetical protein
VENESAGSSPKIPLGLNLDIAVPVFTNGVDSTEPFFRNNVINLPKGETNDIVIEATGFEGDCRWTIAVDYIADGRAATMTVTGPGNQHFELSGRVPASQYESVLLSPLRSDCPTPWNRVTGTDFERIEATGSC